MLNANYRTPSHIAALAPHDYTHAAIAERSRTDWRDEPVIALAPTTKKRGTSTARQQHENKTLRLDMLGASAQSGSPVAANLLEVAR